MSSSASPDATVDDAPPPQPEGSLASGSAPRNTKPPKPAVERTASNASSSAASTDAAPAWTARNSFTADSPYFGAFCDAEVKQLHVLSDSLREIATRTQTLTKTGYVMSHAAQRLAAACKFQSLSPPPEEETAEEKEARVAAVRLNRHVRQQAVGEEMASFLQVLGDVSGNRVGNNVVAVLMRSLKMTLSFLSLTLAPHRCWMKSPRHKYTCVNPWKKHSENH